MCPQKLTTVLKKLLQTCFSEEASRTVVSEYPSRHLQKSEGPLNPRLLGRYPKTAPVTPSRIPFDTSYAALGFSASSPTHFLLHPSQHQAQHQGGLRGYRSIRAWLPLRQGGHPGTPPGPGPWSHLADITTVGSEAYAYLMSHLFHFTCCHLKSHQALSSGKCIPIRSREN